MDPLQRYLQEQSSDGQLDSVGNFTLVWAKAQEKLRQFQLESPAHYVLKLVQAAVSSGAARVSFKIGAKELYCYFTLASHATDLGLDSVASALASPPAEECPLRHLIVGLNASFMGEPKEILWGMWGESEGDAILFGQEHSDRHSCLPHPLPAEAEEGQNFFCFRLTRSNRSGSAAEHALLVERCGYSPIPICIDGKAIGSPVPSTKREDTDISISQGYFLLRYLKNPTEGQIGVSLGDPRDWNLAETWRRRPNPSLDCLQRVPYLLKLDPERGLRGGTERTRCHATVSLGTTMKGLSHLHLVRFGVTMRPLLIQNCRFGADVAMNGADLQVDISEFSVVESAEVRSLQEEAKFHLKKIGKQLESISGLPAFPKDDTTTQLTKFACCCALGWFAIPLVFYEAYRVNKRKAEASTRMDQTIAERAKLMSRLN